MTEDQLTRATVRIAQGMETTLSLLVDLHASGDAADCDRATLIASSVATLLACVCAQAKDPEKARATIVEAARKAAPAMAEHVRASRAFAAATHHDSGRA